LYEQDYSLTSSQFGTLFTIYSLPNVILVYFSGIFIDKYGVVYSSLLFNLLILFGFFVCAIAPVSSSVSDIGTTGSFYKWTPTYAYLLVGRLLLGLGGESIVACASTMLATWFTHNGFLNTALSINQAFVQLFGSSAAFYLLPRFHSIDMVQWVTFGVGIFSIACTVLYAYLQEINATHLTQLNELSSKTSAPSSCENQFLRNVEADERSPLLSPKENTPIENSSLATQSIGRPQFPLLFWLLFLHISLMSPILYTFTAFGPLYLQDGFASLRTSEAAGGAISLLYMGIAFAPLSGFIIDRLGHRALVQLIGNLSILVLFLLLKYAPTINPYYALLVVGLSFSVTEANGLAMISLIAPTEKLGEAYGIIGCGVSVALLFEPALVGYLRDLTGSFAASVWLFLTLISAGAGCCAAILILQRRLKIEF
jgi:MFS family permease